MREWFAPQFEHPGELKECPYDDELPEIEIKSDTEWLINGKPRDIINEPCPYIIRDPRACADCLLNPETRAERGPESAFLAHILYLDGLQLTGALFPVGSLTRLEWLALGLVKSERNRAEIKKMKEKR